MLHEALEALAPRTGGVYVDCTFGRGGHAEELLKHVGDAGRLLAIDRDPAAVEAASALARADARVSAVHAPFSALERCVRANGMCGLVNGVLFDLGVSSPQFDDASRGFSFREDGPLDMRMDPTRGVSAAEWLGGARVEDIARVLKEFGEERYARGIARAIVAERARSPLGTTARLASLVAGVYRARRRGGGREGPDRHPATRTFQAIRIHVNGELDELRAGLAQALKVLAPAGRLVVISFHSLEDRIVKRFIRDRARGPAVPRDLPVTGDPHRPELRPVGKARRPGAEEVRRNPRARSAVMRVAEVPA